MYICSRKRKIIQFIGQFVFYISNQICEQSKDFFFWSFTLFFSLPILFLNSKPNWCIMYLTSVLLWFHSTCSFVIWNAVGGLPWCLHATVFPNCIASKRHLELPNKWTSVSQRNWILLHPHTKHILNICFDSFICSKKNSKNIGTKIVTDVETIASRR